MRWLPAVVVFGACAPAIRAPPSNLPVAEPVIAEPAIRIDPDSEGLHDKRAYWHRWGRAYVSQVPGPVCVCEYRPSLTWDTPAGTQTSYLAVCSTIR